MPAYRRGIFLINKAFQLRFSIYVCLWLTALSFIYPVIIHSLFSYFVSYMELDPMGPALATLYQTRREIIWLLVLFQIIFLVLTFLISVFMSHRIAGPIYKMRKTFEEVKAGDYNAQLHFRKKDHFQEMVGDFNAMMKSIRDRDDQRKDAIAAAIAQLERAAPQVDGNPGRDIQSVLVSLKELRQ